MRKSDFKKVAITLSLYAAVLVLMLGLWSSMVSYSPAEKTIVSAVQQSEPAITIDINDFGTAHQISKLENIQLPSAQRIQSEKLVRHTLFDAASIILLTNNLIFFVRPLYIYLLSPLWRPSISIAQRRLLL